MRALLDTGGVTPGPVQDRLPIWMGYLGPQGARRAGLLGEQLLTGDARNWAPYREGYSKLVTMPRRAAWLIP